MKGKLRALPATILLVGFGVAILSSVGACGSDLAPAPASGKCGSLGTDCNINAGKPFFTDSATCKSYLDTVDPRGPDTNGDFIPDGDNDPSNDGLDDWGRKILDAEAICSCDKCIDQALACQKNQGCREIANCAMNVGCRTIRECFYGENWPGGVGPCHDIIDKWGAQSTSAALGEEISRCIVKSGCPARKCPCAAGLPLCGDASAQNCCYTREEKTCPINIQ